MTTDNKTEQDVQACTFCSKCKKDALKNTKAIVTYVERPARKLILLRSKNATDFGPYCEEMGCDWIDILNDINIIPEKLETSAFVKLPAVLIKEGTSAFAGGVEVPFDYAGPLPAGGYEIIDLPPCTMAYFIMPYENEEDGQAAFCLVWEAARNYKPELHGYKFDNDISPHLNFGWGIERGAKLAFPVAALDKDK